ncbi:MAG TPA: anti-sigma factor [Acidimicrobiales bacterium]|nr:anti-sigma factor [Acidimicrobiales bacterium]
MDSDDLHELVGAYALDALDPDEAQAFESHLETCPRCRAELRDHRDTASFLAHAGAPAPDGLWDRIAANLEMPPPDMARVLPFTNKRRRRFIVALSVAAALLVALNSAVLIQQRNEIRDLRPSRTANLQALAERTYGASGGSRAHLVTANGAVAADAVLTSSGQGYLLHMAMHRLDAAHTYQLWGLNSAGKMVSLGILGTDPKVASFSAKVPITTLAVTIERAQGAVAPTSSPLVTGTLHGA